MWLKEGVRRLPGVRAPLLSLSLALSTYMPASLLR